MPKIQPTFKPIITGFRLFVQDQAFSGLLLLAAVLTALTWANSVQGASYEQLWTSPLHIALGPFSLSMSIHHWINDALMAVFFFVVGLEIKRELLVGELSRPRQALFPVAAAAGGMLVPALIYLALNPSGPPQSGWGIPMATDIAFALGALALVGRRAPIALKVFLTAVAIVDDIGAVLVIALFYSQTLSVPNLLAAGAILLLLLALNRRGVRSLVAYSFLGVLLWLALLNSGIHATIAGVLLAAFIPAKPSAEAAGRVQQARVYLRKLLEAKQPDTLANKDHQEALQGLETAAESLASPLQRLEHMLHPWVAYFIMPIFALSNAGVQMPSRLLEALASPLSLGVFLGLVLGKQVGVFGASWLFARMGWLNKPRSLSWAHIYGAAWLGGIGFTMSLFITHLAFGKGELAVAAKVGILCASFIAALGGSLVLLTAGKRSSKI